MATKRRQLDGQDFQDEEALGPLLAAEEPIHHDDMNNSVRDSSSADKNKADTKGFIPLFVVAQVLGITSFVLCIVWCSKYLGGFGWDNAGQRFNWHPVLMIGGFGLLYGNGMMLYRFLRSEPKPILKLVHAGINGAAFFFSVVSLVAVFSYHNEKKIANLYTLHSWIGLMTVILFGGNLLGGGVAFLLPATPPAVRAFILPLHVFGGVALMGLISVSIVSGILEKALWTLGSKTPGYADLPTEALILNFTGFIFVLFALVVCFITTKVDYKRRPLPAELPGAQSVQMEESGSH